MFQIIAYIKFLMQSKNEHAVHSPFVFDLITKCFYDNTNYSEYQLLNAYRKRLLKNKNRIQVNDFGAGSRYFKSNQRKVSAIARNAGITKKRGRLLARLVAYLDCQHLLELGTSLGIGSTALSTLKTPEKIISVEGCPNTSKVAQEAFDHFSFEHISLKTGKFEHLIPEFQKKTFDLVYFDGNHQKKATLEYFNQLLATIKNNTIFVFDDIHWSKEMEEAWEEIKTHPKVKISIDTFFQGFIFFRKEQMEKEHFIIRV